MCVQWSDGFDPIHPSTSLGKVFRIILAHLCIAQPLSKEKLPLCLSGTLSFHTPALLLLAPHVLSRVLECLYSQVCPCLVCSWSSPVCMHTCEAQICVWLHTAVHEPVSVHVCPSSGGNFLTMPGILSTAVALSSTEQQLRRARRSLSAAEWGRQLPATDVSREEALKCSPCLLSPPFPAPPKLTLR